MGSAPSTVPLNRSTLIGRDEVIEGIAATLERERMVTLTGPGGSGKTRLAVEAAHRFAGRFPDGRWFVDLASASAGGDVVAAFMSGMSMTAVGGDAPIAHASSAIGDREPLLIVDNCEHVLADVAAITDELLGACDGLRILATSRQPLGLGEERVWWVPPLDTSSTTAPAVRLFCNRAVAADPDLALDDATTEVVVEIVRLLDGMPLAIELAAARCRTLSPQQILGHLEGGLGLLKTSSDRVESRQRSLDATIGWSYHLLGSDERRWFRWLCACAGRFSLETTARLLDVDEIEAADVLDALVSRSLLVVDDLGAGMRLYRFLETIRSYGAARLDEVGDRHEAIEALEGALLPAPDMIDDVRRLSTWYTAIVGDRLGEGRTRRSAARVALSEGRLDTAAFIAASSWAPESAATLDVVHALLCELLADADCLSFSARYAALVTKATVEVVSFRYLDCIATCTEALDALDADHPGRGPFEAWLTALSAGTDTVGALTGIDDVIAAQLPHVDGQHDFALGWLHLTKASAAASLGELHVARASARESLRWLSPTVSEQPMTLATNLWLDYLLGDARDPTIEAAARRHAASDIGFEMCAKIALAVTDPAPVDVRAAALADVAGRRPLGRWHREESELLVGFGHLAVEEGRTDDARRLAGATYFRNPSTIIALVHLLARTEGWTPSTWSARLEAATQPRFSPPPNAPDGAAALAVELKYWDARLGTARASATSSEVDVLGPVQLRLRGRTITMTSRQHRAIVAVLATEYPRPVSADELVDAVWGDDPPRTARRSLQAQISRMRSQLDELRVMGDTAEGYRLDCHVDAIDLCRFTGLLDEAASATAGDRVRLLTSALELWRGEPLTDVADTAAARATVAGLRMRHEGAQESLAAAMLETGDTTGAVALLEQLVELQPLNENRWTMLIDALTLADQRGDALRAYQRGRTVLVETLGIEPGEGMRAAEARALG